MTNFGPVLPLESGFLVAGRWVCDGERISIHSPFDGELVGSTFLGTRKDVEVVSVSDVASVQACAGQLKA